MPEKRGVSSWRTGKSCRRRSRKNPQYSQREVPTRQKMKNKISNVSNYFQDVFSHYQCVVMGRKRCHSIKGTKECNEERNQKSNLHLFGGIIFRGTFVNWQAWAVHIRILRVWWKSPEVLLQAAIWMATEHFYSLAVYQQNELFFLHRFKLDSQKEKRPTSFRSLFL